MPMTRVTLALLAIACAAIPACAQWLNFPYLPPAEFDHPYDGQLKIIRVPTREEVQWLCLGGLPPAAIACAKRWMFSNTCAIVIIADDVLATTDLTYELVLQHEIGHCNGWPGDHPN